MHSLSNIWSYAHLLQPPLQMYSLWRSSRLILVSKRSKPTSQMWLMQRPTNYKGCSVYKNPWRKNTSNYQAPSSLQKTQKKQPLEISSYVTKYHRSDASPQKQFPISNILNNTTYLLTSFITKFKSLIISLIFLLTSLIEKLISNNDKK